jgi:hypothetical protein
VMKKVKEGYGPAAESMEEPAPGSEQPPISSPSTDSEQPAEDSPSTSSGQ